MTEDASQPNQKPKRHEPAPRPSKLKPAQNSKLRGLIGRTEAEIRDFYDQCRQRLQGFHGGQFSVDDLINQAVKRLLLGELPKNLDLPKNRHQLIDAVEKLARTHRDNTRRRSLPTVPMNDSHLPQMETPDQPHPTTSLRSRQLELLQRCEEKLRQRLAQLEHAQLPPVASDLFQTIEPF